MTRYSIRVYDADPTACACHVWPTHDGFPLDAETIEGAREEARNILDTEAYGLSSADGYAVGDRIYAMIDDAVDGSADGVSVELTAEHLGEEDDAPADSLDVDAALDAAGWSSTLVDDDRIVIVDAAPDSGDYGGSTEHGSAWDIECDRILGEIREAVEPLGWMADWCDDDIHVEPREVSRG
jgi:hypothetical protein